MSTATSLIVLSHGAPEGLVLQAAGQSVPLLTPVDLGMGADEAGGGFRFWQIGVATADHMLLASAEHVLTATFQGNPIEVTRFTTAAGYDKVEGVAPVLNALHLWRVRYPVADIASGNCVFAEYHGFISVDYIPATVPNTAAASVVHTFGLTPKTGGSEQSLLYVGETAFTGLKPEGTYPLPLGVWQPELDPTRTYCLTVTAFGDGDRARPPLTSQQLCADVVQLSAAGAPAPTQIAGSGGGCTIAGVPGTAGPACPLAIAIGIALGLRRRGSRG